MKNRFFCAGILFALLTAVFFLSGCNLSGSTSFALEAPGCSATWNETHTWVGWSKVEGADFYVVYGKRFTIGDPLPRNFKNFIELYRTSSNDVFSFDHITKDDYCYAVRAFTHDGRASDFSNIAFTW